MGTLITKKLAEELETIKPVCVMCNQPAIADVEFVHEFTGKIMSGPELCADHLQDLYDAIEAFDDEED